MLKSTNVFELLIEKKFLKRKNSKYPICFFYFDDFSYDDYFLFHKKV